jgi:hypothetical protein
VIVAAAVADAHWRPRAKTELEQHTKGVARAQGQRPYVTAIPEWQEFAHINKNADNVDGEHG